MSPRPASSTTSARWGHHDHRCDAAADPDEPRLRRRPRRRRSMRRAGCRSGPATRSSSSARICSRSSPTRFAAPTTAWRTCPPTSAQRGVITASAGNHAQGVAYSARHLGLDALIVMPQTTPAIKVDGGARAGRRRSSSPATASPTPSSAATRSPPRANRVVIHAFDDPLVIAGQGTVARRFSARRATTWRDLRADRRRRADRRHRQLREGGQPVDQGDRRRAVRGRCDVPIARSRPPRHAGSRRHLRRRRRRSRGRRPDLCDRADARGRNRPRLER